MALIQLGGPDLLALITAVVMFTSQTRSTFPVSLAPRRREETPLKQSRGPPEGLLLLLRQLPFKRVNNSQHSDSLTWKWKMGPWNTGRRLSL